MSIFALDERTWIVALRVSLATAISVVHRTEDVGLAILSCLLVLYWASLVDRLHKVVGILEVLAISGLVAKTPYNY